MSKKSFFEEFSELINPDITRPVERGDYYDSPLRNFGIPENEAYQINPELMRLSTARNGISVPITLYDIEINRAYNIDKLIAFKKKIWVLFFSETCLRIFSRNDLELYSDFFYGITDHLGLYHDSRNVKNKIYKYILHAALAVIWNRYKQLDCPLPKSSKLTTSVISTCSIDKSDLISIYNELYIRSNNGPLKKFLDQNMKNYNDGTCDEKFIAFRSCTSLYNIPKEIDCSFSESPWNIFFHPIARAKNNLYFNRPIKRSSGGYFTFSSKEQSIKPLWHTLLLIELHENLKEVLEKNGQPWIASNPISRGKVMHADLQNSVEGEIARLTTTDPNAEPQIAQILRDGCQNRRTSAARFVRPAFENLTQASSSIPVIDDSNGLGKSVWNEPINASAFSTWNITLDIEESQMSTICGLDWLFHIEAYYFHDNSRTTIPCDLVEEDVMEKNGTKRAYFEIGLDNLVIESLGFKPNEVRCKAGFTGIEGEGWLVIVFLAD